ncbi:MAG: acyltransferase [Pseudomonadales bacterium]
MNQHFYNIQALRGIAVLLVIFFHITGVQIKSSVNYPLPEILQFGAVGVDIFFLISGFLMMTITQEIRPNTKAAGHFFKRRALRIYPMYWVVSIPIAYLLFFGSREVLAALKLNPDAVQRVQDLPIYLLKSALLLPQVNLPPLMISWTLIHEVYFYCAFTFLLLIPNRLRCSVLLAWSLATLLFWLALKPTQYQPISYLLCNPLTLEFTTGCFLAVLLRRITTISYNPRLIFLLGCITIVISWVLWTSKNNYEFPIADDRVLYFLLPCTLLMVGAVTMEQQKIYFYPVLHMIGDASYSLYLTHIIVLSIGRKLWKLQGFEDSLFNHLWFWPSLFTCALIVGVLSYRYIEKPLLQIGRTRRR